MGAVVEEAGRHGRKSLNTELNLVPFIDLLSCLISFLLITAVWTRITAVQASTPLQHASHAPSPELDNSPRIVVMESDRYVLHFGRESHVIAPTNGHFDTDALAKKLSELRQQHQSGPVRIRAWDEVAYDDLARTMDTLSASGWSDVIITPAT